MRPTSFINSALALSVCLVAACAPLRPRSEAGARPVITVDNQEGIWMAGLACYHKGDYLAAADLMMLAYRLKPADWLGQNIGMAYLRAAQAPEYLELLRLEYARRALQALRGYRSKLLSDYGRTHPIATTLSELNQHIADAERLERELRQKTDPPRRTASLR